MAPLDYTELSGTFLPGRGCCYALGAALPIWYIAIITRCCYINNCYHAEREWCWCIQSAQHLCSSWLWGRIEGLEQKRGGTGKKNGGRNLGRGGSEERKEWGLGRRGRCRTWWQCNRDDLRPSLRAEDEQSPLVHVGPAGSCSLYAKPSCSSDPGFQLYIWLSPADLLTQCIHLKTISGRT